MKTKVKLTVGEHVLKAGVPREWLDSRRGWELIGGELGDAYEATLSGLRDAGEGDPVPAVHEDEGAAAEAEPQA